jgi:hypothetical protein
MCELDIIAAIKDVLVGAAAVTTAGVAIYGLNRWRSELRGRAEFQTARELMRATYQVRDQIRSVRAPFIAAQEFPEGYSSLGGHSTVGLADAWVHVYRNRWKPLQRALIEMETQQLEAEVLWGKAIREKSDDLLSCANELFAAIEAVVSDKAQGGEDFRVDPEFGKDMKAIVSRRPKKEDHFGEKVLSAVEAVEAEVKPHVQNN